MDKKEWEDYRNDIVDEHQELPFYLDGKEWWISRLYGEEKKLFVDSSKFGHAVFRNS